MRSLFLLLLLLPIVSFSQEIVGKWVKNDFPDQVTEFRKDGIVKSVKAGEPKAIESQSFIKYTTVTESGITYIIYEFHMEGHGEDVVKCQYVLEGYKLIIFKKVINYENITTSREMYRTVEVNYTRIIE